MKRIMILLAGICFAASGMAQTDSTKNQSDTIRIGGMIIIKKKGDNSESINIESRRHYKPSKLSTNWWIVDIGFANFTDNTNYAAARASGFVSAEVGEEQFNLRDGKSVDVNIWIFMQRLSIVKNVVNLKYGVGLELNNYRYKHPIKFETDPTHVILDDDPANSYSKNKLAADYVTVPLMINFNFTPERKQGFGFSAGISGGYLYSARQKTITAVDGKKKEHDDFDLRKWKLSYIAELQLGPIKFFGSMATQSMFEKGLDQTPYNIGIRLSNW